MAIGIASAASADDAAEVALAADAVADAADAVAEVDDLAE
tara:strand:- start:27 stop:146 length:120 start_codon:yes stop_codon:yes gene_type:complete